MFNLAVLTLEKEIFRGKVESVVVPGKEGELGILTHHVPLVTALKEGELTIVQEGRRQRIPLKKGFLEVRPNEVVLLIEQA